MMNQVETFYDAHAQYEWERLERHRMEFSLNMRLLADHLPAAPCAVLDIGGGPGRYSISLARLGYKVTLFDLSAGCLAFASRKAAEEGVTLAGTVHGNALDLGTFADATFDAVLVMGPMYHLLTADDRDRALREAHRVLRPGGVVAVAFIGRYARMRVQQPAWIISHLAQVQTELATGLRRDHDGGFTDAYCAHPAEVAPLLERNGFTCDGLIASEGLRSDIDGAVLDLNEEDWAKWVELNYRLARDPSVLGMAVHLLAVGHKA